MISASELKKHFVEEVNSNTITNQHDGNRTSVDYERDEMNIKHMHGENWYFSIYEQTMNY